MSFSKVEYGDFFERRGREGCAKSAEEDKEKKYKIKKIKNTFLIYSNQFTYSFFFGFPFLPSFLRPLRNLRALCVQKLPAFAAIASNHLTGAATK
jgi:hypothetical protein